MARKAHAIAPPAEAPIVIQQPGGNRAAMQEEMFQEIDQLAVDEGSGTKARPKLAVLCVKYAARGEADVGDAEPIYMRYLSRAEAESEEFGGIRKKGTEEVGLKQNISKLRQFLKFGSFGATGAEDNINPVQFIDRVVEQVKDLRGRGVIQKSPFDAMLNIIRVQNKNPKIELTQEEMIDCNRPKAPKDITEVNSLGSIYNDLEAHTEKWGDSDETTQALESLSARIDALGGTIKSEKEETRVEKAPAKNNKKKVKRK